MRLSIDVTLDYVLKEPADILLQIEAAATPDQRLDHLVRSPGRGSAL